MTFDRNQQQDLAEVRLAATRGVYNISPWPYIFGIGMALFATLFAAYAATRPDKSAAGSTPLDAAPIASERLIWVQ